MKTDISALIDGELDSHEMRKVCISMRRDAALRRTCGIYVLIGDALRHEPCLTTEITGAVLDHLADEPVILAPGALALPQREKHQWLRPALGMAAAVAGVAVVSWLALPLQSTQQLQPTPQLSQAEQKQTKLASDNNDADMQEYLIAHHIHSGSIYLNGETQHIRTVSLNGAGLAR